jgi:hypothetical protein
MIPRCLFASIELVSRRACDSAAQVSWDHGEGGVQRGWMTFLPKELYAEPGAEARLGGAGCRMAFSCAFRPVRWSGRMNEAGMRPPKRGSMH